MHIVHTIIFIAFWLGIILLIGKANHKHQQKQEIKNPTIGTVTTKRPTGTRFVLFGPLSFFFPKKEKYKIKKRDW